MIPNNITKEHVLAAIADIDKNGLRYELGKSSVYDLLYDGKTYPPKHTIIVANEFANKELLGHKELTTQMAQRFLNKLSADFVILKKNEDVIKILVEDYKESLVVNGFSEEVYKWELLTKYGGRPDTEVADFGAEIRSIDYKNLIYHNGIAVRNHIVLENSEGYRECFKNLFNEVLPLNERILTFKEQVDTIYKNMGMSLFHQHDERSIATFLTFKFPNKYAFYKNSFYTKYGKLKGVKPFKKNTKYVHYLDLLNEFINQYIIPDIELKEIVNDLLPKGLFSDPGHTLLAQDILYKMLDKKAPSFTNTILELEATLSEEDSVLNKFIFNKSKSTFKDNGFDSSKKDSFVWISDALNKIGNTKAHYEISIRTRGEMKNCFFVDIHFEDSEKLKFKNIIGDLLPEELTWIDWQGGQSIGTKIGISPNDEDIIEKLMEQLLYIETNIGDSVRKIMDTNNIVRDNEKVIISPLNQILYGPPGTGKTYHTINKALAIIENKDEEALAREERFKIKERFDDYIKEGQIVFTTFHQSMSYEDFVEGIKPALEDDDEIDGKEESSIHYKRKSGIFKTACAFAAYNSYQAFNTKNEKINKSYSFDNLYEAFIGHIQTLIKENGNPSYKSFSGKDTSIISINKNDSIHALSKNSSGIRKPAPLTKENIEKLYNKYQSITEIKSLSEVKETVGVSPRTTEFYAVFGGLKDFEKDFLSHLNNDDLQDFQSNLSEEEIIKKFESGVFNQAINTKDLNPVPVILIIDEINRGNVSGIFGELITLIEDNKRAGQSEALSVTLPYSNSKFTIPSNLYIIGTMNTADRSVEALDSALRRRFSFVEMFPKPELLSPQNMLYRLWLKYWNVKWDDKEWRQNELELCELLGINPLSDLLSEDKKDLENKFKDENSSAIFDEYVKGVVINLESLLFKINKRLEKLLSRDHAIGHSFFINVCNTKTLYKAFYDKIIPLLQEYFFGDYGKIGLVLGNNFIYNVESDDSEKITFAKFDDYEDVQLLLDKKVYHIRNFNNDLNVDYSAFLTAIKAI